MAGSFANSAEDAVLEAFRGTAFTVPATLYMLLSTTTIADDGTGATEPSGSNYSRTAVSMNTTTWGAVSGGAMSNAVAITTATASGSWGTITDIAFISTASGAGTTYIVCTLNAGVAVASGQAFNLPVGDLDVSIT